MFKVMYGNWCGEGVEFEGTYEECMKFGQKMWDEVVLDPYEEEVFMINENDEKVYTFYDLD